MRIGSQLRSHARRAGTAAALALALAGLPTAATAAGAGGSSGVPASLRQHNTDGWWYTGMHLPQVQKHLNGAGVTVAVIDGPVDTAAPDLRGADITLGQNCQGGMTKSQAPTQENADAPGGDHGTAMAADIVGQGHGSGPGGAGILGIAPRAHLLFYGAETAHGRGAGNICRNTGPLIRAAVNAGADIISMSFGATTDNLDQRKAALWAEKKGVVLVAAAGDTGGAAPSPTVGFPAGDPGVVAVNAINKAAKPWARNPAPTTLPAGGNGVPAVDAFPVISAPGVHTGALLWSHTRGFVSTAWVNGTSPATAIVSGALALVKQKYPKATGNQLIQNLIHNPGGTGYGWDRHYGFGIVSVPHMLAQDPTKWPDVNPLLNGPDAAIKNFPASSYGHPAAAQGTQSHPAKKASDTTSTHNSPAMPGNGGGGMPAWVWVVIAAVVVGLGGAAAKLGLSKRSAT